MRVRLLLTFCALAVLLSGTAYGAAIFNVDPTATYLRVDGTASAAVKQSANLLFINLSSLGLGAGDMILIQTLGDYYCGVAGSGCSGSEEAWPLAGVFTVTAALNPDWSLLDRLDTVQNIDGNPIGAGNLTWPGGQPTDISRDFEIPLAGGIVTIPTGANYLAVAAIDSWYDDNYDADDNLQVSIEQYVIPEPGTLALLLPGLGLLLVAARRRKSS